MEEIRFLRDDLEEQRKENIKALMSFLEEKPVSNEVFATKRFMVSAIYAAKTIKDRRIMEEKKKQESFRPKIILKTEKPNAMPVVEEELPVLELPEIEIPVVGIISEIRNLKDLIKSTADALIKKNGIICINTAC